MANLISAGNFNFTDTNGWRLADTGGAQTNLNSSTSITTSNQSSSAFTITNGKVTDGVLMVARQSSTTGTITIELFNGTSVVATTTVNATSLPIASSLIFFKWASPYTSTGLATMTIRVRASSSGNSTFHTSGGSEFFKLIRLNSSDVATAASGDSLFTVGELDNTNTLTSFTVTMDNTASTVWGRSMVGYGGLLNYGIAASTAYLFKTNANFGFYGGELRMGNLANPIPSTSTAELWFVNASSQDFGFDGGSGTLTTYGAARTLYVSLAADAASSATSLTLDSVPTGWKSGDTIAIAPSTGSSFEKKVLSADVTTTTATITAGLTFAHSGTAPTRCEVVNLQRNVKIHGTSAAIAFSIGNNRNYSLNNTEFYFCGGMSGLSGSSMSGCVFHDTDSTGNMTNEVAQFSTVTGCAVMSEASGTNHNGSILASTSFASTITNNIVSAARNHCMQVTSVFAHVITGNRSICDGNGSGYNFTMSDGSSITFNNNLAHSCASGIMLGVPAGGSTPSISNFTITNFTGWRGSSGQIAFNGSGSAPNAQFHNITINGATLFGNSTAGIAFTNATVANCSFKNIAIDAGVTVLQPVGISIRSRSCLVNVVFDMVNMGVSQTHATADLQIADDGSGTLAVVDARFRNCRFSSTTEISGQALLSPLSTITSQKHDATVNNHRSWSKYGTMTIDTSIFATASPSARMTPNNASNKYAYPRAKQMAVSSGGTASVSVKVRKSVVGDGTAYNGNQPRLILKANAALGINSDVVLATATNAANGAFVILTGTSPSVTDHGVLEFMVDCDGTTGWINVDDWGP
jgi:hypothetical protein